MIDKFWENKEPIDESEIKRKRRIGRIQISILILGVLGLLYLMNKNIYSNRVPYTNIVNYSEGKIGRSFYVDSGRIEYLNNGCIKVWGRSQPFKDNPVRVHVFCGTFQIE